MTETSATSKAFQVAYAAYITTSYKQAMGRVSSEAVTSAWKRVQIARRAAIKARAAQPAGVTPPAGATPPASTVEDREVQRETGQ